MAVTKSKNHNVAESPGSQHDPVEQLANEALQNIQQMAGAAFSKLSLIAHPHGFTIDFPEAWPDQLEGVMQALSVRALKNNQPIRESTNSQFKITALPIAVSGRAIGTLALVWPERFPKHLDLQPIQAAAN